MSSYKVYDLFLNKLIESSLRNSITSHDVQNEEQKGNPDFRYQAETFKEKLGYIALNLAGYSSYQHNESDLKELELSNLEFDLLHSIITSEHLDVNKTIARFVHKSMQNFLVANRIVEELTQSSITDGDSISETSKNMLINQESLINSSLPFSIVHFIVDAVKDETISADTLVRLVKKSRRKTSSNLLMIPNEEKKSSDEVLDPHVSSKEILLSSMKGSLDRNRPHDGFSLAASNAITILKMSGYDFSLMDFSGISIPCADLSYGIFEGTNFTGANLQRVNFTESWLKDATFVDATMKEVNFGLKPELKLDKEASCIAYFSERR